MRHAVLVLLVALCAAPADAQVYRWVDKDGKVHYSDKKPKDAAAKELAIQSQASDPAAAEKAMAELKAQNEGLDEADAQRKQDAARQAQAKQQREAQCKSAQSEVQLLSSVNRYYTVDHKGDRVYDTDAQLEARRGAARARAAQLCD
jgi:hypothetical protein